MLAKLVNAQKPPRPLPRDSGPPTDHLFPLVFFFLPPPAPPFVPSTSAALGTGVATPLPSSPSTSILSPSAVAATAAALSSAITSPLANRPNPVINLPTSAALFVVYFNVMPEGGWYVFRVRVAADGGGKAFGWEGGGGGGALEVSVSDDVAAAFDRERFEGLGSVYLVVMRVSCG